MRKWTIQKQKKKWKQKEKQKNSIITEKIKTKTQWNCSQLQLSHNSLPVSTYQDALHFWKDSKPQTTKAIKK